MKYDDFVRLLTPLANPLRAAQMQAYMKNRFSFLGIPKPQLKATLKPHLKAAAREGVDWQTIDACWQAEAREYQYAALELLRAVQKQLTPADLPCLHRLITDLELPYKEDYRRFLQGLTAVAAQL